MKKRMKKTVTWLMIVCMFMGFLPAFGSAAAAEERTASSFVWDDSEPGLGDLQAEEEGKGLNNIFDLLTYMFKAIAENLRALSVDDVLKLPANSMADVLTYIFSLFKMLGLPIDALYEKVISIFLAR